jgi:hypothetical protein
MCSFCIRTNAINIIFILLVLLLLAVKAGDIELNPGPSNGTCKNLNVCHVNIRSLSRSKLLALQTSLAKLYDIITISETHLHPGVPNDTFELKGYHDIIRKDRAGRGGGVAIYVKENICYKRIYLYEKPSLEALWIQINTVQGKVLICSCYRPPDNNNFWNDFEMVLDEIKTNQINNIFIFGDLNADFKTVSGRKLQQMCRLQNFDLLVNEPTRITNSTATVLDQIVTNAPNFVKKIDVTPPISTNDHCTVGAILNFKVRKEAAYYRTVWLYKDANYEEFRNTLAQADFNGCFNTNSIDEACDLWTETFLNTARTVIPNRVVTIRSSDSPWYTGELRCMKRKMMRFFHKYKHSKAPTDWEKYKKMRNDYQKELSNAEEKYKKSLMESLSGNRNTKKWWSTVKTLLGKGGDTSYPPLDIHGKQVSDNKDKA